MPERGQQDKRWGQERCEGPTGLQRDRTGGSVPTMLQDSLLSTGIWVNASQNKKAYCPVILRDLQQKVAEERFRESSQKENCLLWKHTLSQALFTKSHLGCRVADRLERAEIAGGWPVTRLICKGALSVNPCFNLFKKHIMEHFKHTQK